MMKRLLLFVGLTSLMFGQSAGVGSNWTVLSGTLQSSAVANGNGTALPVQGLAAAAVTVNCSVACSGGTTITFQGSQDGTNYVPINGSQLAGTTTASAVVNQSTPPTVWWLPVAGLQYIRAVVSAYSAGTVTVTATAVATTPSTYMANVSNNFSQLNGVALGSPSNYGTSPGSVSVQGVNAYVTNTVPVTISSMPSTPVTGTFWQATQPVSGTFWQTTQPVSIASMPTTAVTGTFWQTTQPVSIASMPTTAVTIASMPSTPVTGTFWQATQPVSGSVSVSSMPTTAVTGTFWQTTQPVSIASMPTTAVTLATAPALVAGSATIGSVKVTDGTNTVQVDPCVGNVKSMALINLTASGQVITGTSSKKTYVCALNLITAAAQNIALVEGTGTTCATGIAGMAGGTTAAAGWNFGANAGLTLGNGAGSVLSAPNAAADNVCLLLSGTGQTSGTLMYVQQ